MKKISLLLLLSMISLFVSAQIVEHTYHFENPVVNEIRMNCRVEDMAIAQHYEFPTEYMDITNNKWVAAFFAATYKSGNLYLPTETGFGNGIGVFYISNDDMHISFFERK